ncbi:MAG: transcriptional repressor [Candidatus Omnitrophica bacterium]|nr:transcriptional repressor [Candidatus Omnitrophota bacterium]MBU4149390.1 transcriptional repressor [Candidatus Omnitrophota bacterium]
MSEEMNIFVEYLKKKDLKLTDQRREILNTFLRIDKHLSVEELYDIAKKKDPSIGQATVFRTLKILCDADIAKEVDLGDGKVRYEHKYGHEHHDHLICTKCGRFIEVVDSQIEKLQEEMCKQRGFTQKLHKMEIFGICKNCRKK